MIEPTKYVRKPFEVEAVEVTDDNIEEVSKWCNGQVIAEGNEKQTLFIKVHVARALNERQTKAYPGDWVLYAGTGFKVYTAKAFHRTFEPGKVRLVREPEDTQELMVTADPAQM